MPDGQDLIPKGLRAEALSIRRGRVDISVAPVARSAQCPVCGRPSRRGHSSYSRKIADLPWHGAPVVFRAQVRRFFCNEPSCERGIFCERLPEVAAHARKTDRLETALLAIVTELGGRAGARLAFELGLLLGRDALLSRAKCAAPADAGKVRVLGVDDFAFRRGARYGTILVDLERHRVADLLPERSQESLVVWLGRHPGVETAARDRSNIYREALAKGAPTRRKSPTAGTCCTTSRSCWKSYCYRKVPRCARRPHRRQRPKTGATTPSVRGPSCRTVPGTTTAR